MKHELLAIRTENKLHMVNEEHPKVFDSINKAKKASRKLQQSYGVLGGGTVSVE